MSLFEEFEKIVRAFPQKTAVFFEDNRQFQSITFQELYNQAVSLGDLLLSKGDRENDKIAILISNQPEWPIAFMAIQYIGGTAVPLDVKLPREDLENLISHSGAKTVLCSEKTFESTGKNLKNTKKIEVVKLKKNVRVASQIKKFIGGDKPAAMFYTSGTTDNPKGVLLSNKNLLSNIEAIKQLNITNEQDVIISILPLHHTYAFTVTCLLSLLEGASISYPASINPEDFLRCMQETKTSVLVGVPQLFALLHHGIHNRLGKLPKVLGFFINILLGLFLVLRKLCGINLAKLLLAEAHKKFGGNLRFMVSGGARLDPKLARDLFTWGFSVIEGYGLTETSPIITFNPVNKVKFGSVGKPIPGVEVKINRSDETGIGEISVHGDNIMLGYFNREEDTGRVIREGWFFTGDLGYFDKDGYLFITGRKDELIVLSTGKKVNPEELEYYYGMSPYVKEVCVFASQVKDSTGIIQKLSAIIVPDEDYFRLRGEVNFEDKIKWDLDNISHRLAAEKRIQGFFISKNKLPRTPLGKIMRHKINEKYLTESIVVPQKMKDAPQTGDPLLANETNLRILEYLSKKLNKEITLDDHIELDLGLDSLGRVELFLDVQQMLNIEISDSFAMELFYVNTIRELLLKIMPFYEKETLQTEEHEVTWLEILKQSPSTATLNSIILNPSFMDKLVNFLFYSMFKFLFTYFLYLRVEGRENLPKKGPYLIYPNHTSYLDGFLVSNCVSFREVLTTYFLVFKDYVSGPIVKKLAKIGRLIPVNINLDIMELLRICSFLLTHGKSICFFPEGERSSDGEVIKFRKGIGILAKELKIPLIPAYIDGSFFAWSRHAALPRPAIITVRFGKPLIPGKDISEAELKALNYDEVAERLRQELLKLSK